MVLTPWLGDAATPHGRSRSRFTSLLVLAVIAASHALAGRAEKAEQATVRLREFDPKLRVSNLMDYFVIRLPEHREISRTACAKRGCRNKNGGREDSHFHKRHKGKMSSICRGFGGAPSPLVGEGGSSTRKRRRAG
jgi:hypothetical protein